MGKKWYTIVTQDAHGRRLRQLIGRHLTLGEALQWLRGSGEPIATLFEESGGKWKHLPWAWVGLQYYKPLKLAATSTWGARA